MCYVEAGSGKKGAELVTKRLEDFLIQSEYNFVFVRKLFLKRAEKQHAQLTELLIHLIARNL